MAELIPSPAGYGAQYRVDGGRLITDYRYANITHHETYDPTVPGRYRVWYTINSDSTPEGTHFVRWESVGSFTAEWQNKLAGRADTSIEYSNDTVATTLLMVAVFESDAPQKYHLTTQVFPLGFGITTGDGDYAEGTPVVITSTPIDIKEYRFLFWEIEGEIIKEPEHIVIMPNHDVLAVAVFRQYTHLILRDDSGKIIRGSFGVPLRDD